MKSVYNVLLPYAADETYSRTIIALAAAIFGGVALRKIPPESIAYRLRCHGRSHLFEVAIIVELPEQLQTAASFHMPVVSRAYDV